MATRTSRCSMPSTARTCSGSSSTISSKAIDNGWDKQPKVLLNIRHPGEKFVPRAENEWPLARTQWTKFYLHSDRELEPEPRRPTRRR